MYSVLWFSAKLFTCRLGEVTLKDFKVAIDREGAHRYHFKALDPEFGTVKEEVGVEFNYQAALGSVLQHNPGDLGHTISKPIKSLNLSPNRLPIFTVVD